MQAGTENTNVVYTEENIDIYRSGGRVRSEKELLKESIFEVYINGVVSLRITCTPTNIQELVIGRLYTEGFISELNSVSTLKMFERTCRVEVELKRKDKPHTLSTIVEVPTTGRENEVLCRYDLPDATSEPYRPTLWDAEVVFGLYDKFALDTPLHSRTAGTHSCHLALDGEVVFVSEDIGRHNALDKAVGYAMLRSFDFTRIILFTSGRIPVDMIFQVINARMPVLASKAAPTDQAVKLAREYGVALICKVGDDRITVFSGAENEKNACRQSKKLFHAKKKALHAIYG